MHSNLLVFYPQEANKRVISKRKLKKKVRFLENDIQGNDVPHCRRKLAGTCNEYGFLHTASCRNRRYEEALSPTEFEKRANFLGVLVETDAGSSPSTSDMQRKVEKLDPRLLKSDTDGNLSMLSSTMDSVEIHKSRNPELEIGRNEFRKPTRETNPMDCKPTFSDDAIDFSIPKEKPKPEPVSSERESRRTNSISSVDSGYLSSAEKDKEDVIRELLSSSDSESEDEVTVVTTPGLDDSDSLVIKEITTESQPKMWFETQAVQEVKKVVNEIITVQEGYKNPFKATAITHPSVSITTFPSTLGKLVCHSRPVQLPKKSITELFPRQFQFDTPSPDDIVKNRQKFVGCGPTEIVV